MFNVLYFIYFETIFVVGNCEKTDVHANELLEQSINPDCSVSYSDISPKLQETRLDEARINFLQYQSACQYYCNMLVSMEQRIHINIISEISKAIVSLADKKIYFWISNKKYLKTSISSIIKEFSTYLSKIIGKDKVNYGIFEEESFHGVINEMHKDLEFFIKNYNVAKKQKKKNKTMYFFNRLKNIMDYNMNYANKRHIILVKELCIYLKTHPLYNISMFNTKNRHTLLASILNHKYAIPDSIEEETKCRDKTLDSIFEFIYHRFKRQNSYVYQDLLTRCFALFALHKKDRRLRKLIDILENLFFFTIAQKPRLKLCEYLEHMTSVHKKFKILLTSISNILNKNISIKIIDDESNGYIGCLEDISEYAICLEEENTIANIYKNVYSIKNVSM